MRIPLDYYRILGVPAQTDLTQLEQAYQDRLLQLPRREYSELAIESRKELLTVAYQVLSDPVRRAEYEATFLAPSPQPVVHSEEESTSSNLLSLPVARLPEVEIAPEHFLGALLILFEQGEYEQITTICFPYIGNNGNSNNSGSLIRLSPIDDAETDRQEFALDRLRLIKPDVVLTFALSVVELGTAESREKNYEEAGSYYETALRLLAHEDLFLELQEKIEKNLDKLRPYRVLHLVSLPEDRHELRQKGLNLLTEMMSVCCANQTICKERFGLSADGTLRFIDRFRPYLTVAEQQHLFSQSAGNSQPVVCTYLLVYALIARGFAYRNPQLISTASQILLHRLSQRHDVRLEQAICALLLGQTEEVNQILSSLPDTPTSIVIRQQSQGAADLLPGLCWYVQNEWLPKEVFPSFRDLVGAQVSLDAYFQDPFVVTVLDHPGTQAGLGSWIDHTPQLINVPISGNLSLGENQAPPTNLNNRDREIDVYTPSTSSNLFPVWQSSPPPLIDGNIPTAERVFHHPPAPREILPELLPSQETEPAADNIIDLERERARRHPRTATPTANTMTESSPARIADGSTGSLVPVDRSGGSTLPRTKTSQLARRRRRRKLNVNVPRLVLVGAGAIAVTSAGVFLAQSAWNGIQTVLNPTEKKTTGGGSTPPLPPNSSASTPSEKPQPLPIVGLLTTASAQQLVNAWLAAKAESLGKEYQTAKLSEVLVEPALSRALDRAQTERAKQAHWSYKHPLVQVESVSQRDPQANSAYLIAKVREEAQYYQNEQLNSDRSYNKNVRVKYDLLRQADRWYIKDMTVIN